ncbi:hypothetical protein EDB83DRAFT_2555986 [Lactarius deliciosus]|nr:hypothetical protein EDB83DRAFT_2555986 [Lactarius deliciosus]
MTTQAMCLTRVEELVISASKPSLRGEHGPDCRNGKRTSSNVADQLGGPFIFLRSDLMPPASGPLCKVPDAVPQHELDASDHWPPSTSPPSGWNGVCRSPRAPKAGPGSAPRRTNAKKPGMTLLDQNACAEGADAFQDVPVNSRHRSRRDPADLLERRVGRTVRTELQPTIWKRWYLRTISSWSCIVWAIRTFPAGIACATPNERNNEGNCAVKQWGEEPSVFVNQTRTRTQSSQLPQRLPPSGIKGVRTPATLQHYPSLRIPPAFNDPTVDMHYSRTLALHDTSAPIPGIAHRVHRAHHENLLARLSCKGNACSRSVQYSRVIHAFATSWIRDPIRLSLVFFSPRDDGHLLPGANGSYQRVENGWWPTTGHDKGHDTTVLGHWDDHNKIRSTQTDKEETRSPQLTLTRLGVLPPTGNSQSKCAIPPKKTDRTCAEPQYGTVARDKSVRTMIDDNLVALPYADIHAGDTPSSRLVLDFNYCSQEGRPALLVRSASSMADGSDGQAADRDGPRRRKSRSIPTVVLRALMHPYRAGYTFTERGE